MVRKLNGESFNITKQNMERLKELFPEVVTDGEKIDFDMLKTVLGDVVEDHHERYQFTWHGKKQAILGAQKPSKGTLRPVPEKSKHFDSTENLYIEGDNLEVLKQLQKAYNSKITMIYIDPPYNTGRDFVYKDNFRDGVQNYLEQTGQVDSEGNNLSTNTESNGRYHTDWLNMMYPRLKLSRNLLTDDGVIFISIGQAELANLQKICNEIFGENNCLGLISRQMKSGGGSQGKYFAHNIDYILVYAKIYDKARYFRGEISEDLIKKVYNQKETEGKRKGEWYRSMGLYQSSLGVRPGLRYYIKCPDGSFAIPPGETFPEILAEGEKSNPISTDGVWRWSYDKYVEELNNGNILFKETSKGTLVDQNGKPSKWNIYTKIWLKDRQEEGQIPNDLITRFENRHSSKEIQELNIPFDFAKPVDLIKYLINMMQQEKDITILDFFSGSATTAHAVMKLNAEDNGNRKFIMVQLPEVIDEKSVAYKHGYRTICDIGEERIRRAGDKIYSEWKEKINDLDLSSENQVDPDSLDIGFKVFKLDTSNIREWNVDFDELEDQLDLYETPFIDGRSELDVVYEIMLKYGLKLSSTIQTFEVDGKKVYDIAHGNLFICLADSIDTGIAKAIIAKRDEYGRQASSVVFLDHGFAGNDAEKLNCMELLKDAGYPEDNLLTI